MLGSVTHEDRLLFDAAGKSDYANMAVALAGGADVNRRIPSAQERTSLFAAIASVGFAAFSSLYVVTDVWLVVLCACLPRVFGAVAASGGVKRGGR